jgi:hypothetical protein
VRDEVLLVRGELFPVLHVVLQIDFLCEIVVESERERERERERVSEGGEGKFLKFPRAIFKKNRDTKEERRRKD